MATVAFVTAINCMDGRTQAPVSKWMKATFGADYIDTITEPGPDGILAGPSSSRVTSIKDRVLISVHKHNSRVVAVVGHDECAGNPVSKEEHLDMIDRAARTVAGWGLNVTVVGLWLAPPDWKVEKVCEIEP